MSVDLWSDEFVLFGLKRGLNMGEVGLVLYTLIHDYFASSSLSNAGL